jgi:RNA polymerase sigma-70 factor, ECF subfamily
VSPADAAAAVARAHREEWVRVVAALARRFGSLDLAEESAAEAFATAVERWPVDGVPPNPGGWLTVTASRKALDRLRRESRRDEKHREAEMLRDDSPPEPVGAVGDDRLRLIFTCCHPALAAEARIALTLRLVGGLTVPEIAAGFLVKEATIGQRITRAKAKIAGAGIPYRVPAAADLPARVDGVLAVLYLIATEAHLASGAETDPIRADLGQEAIRLARLVRELLPGDGEAAGLLALLLFTEARRPARLDAAGALVALDRQDRALWDGALVAEGAAILGERIASGEAPGRYQLMAAIAAEHSAAPSVAATDWAQIAALYEHLAHLDPSPVVALNRAIAVAELDGPAVALAAVDRLEPALAGYHPFHATRAELLRRLGRAPEADAAYAAAIATTANPAEAAALAHRRADALEKEGAPRPRTPDG